MDYTDALTTIGIAATGLGGYISGRFNGRSSASQIASDTVTMLNTQIEMFQREKEHREVELSDLRSRVTVLEDLVTQRAGVELLGERVTLVKDAVDRIAEKMGATCEAEANRTDRSEHDGSSRVRRAG